MGFIPHCTQYIVRHEGDRLNSFAVQMDSEGRASGIRVTSEIEKDGSGKDYFFGKVYPYQIIHTDYQNYLIAYMCQEMEG